MTYQKGDLAKYLKTINGKNGWIVKRYGSRYEVMNFSRKLQYNLQQRTKFGESYIVREIPANDGSNDFLHPEITLDEIKDIIEGIEDKKLKSRGAGSTSTSET